jgi:enamine deaminase RidA (YjgF/YER057c/UK114 family)
VVSGKGSQQGAERRLQHLGIELPAAPTPFGTYVEALQTGSLLFLSGMLPVVDHKAKYVGRLGKVLDAGHFALDTKADEITALVRDFMKTQK